MILPEWVFSYIFYDQVCFNDSFISLESGKIQGDGKHVMVYGLNTIHLYANEINPKISGITGYL